MSSMDPRIPITFATIGTPLPAGAAVLVAGHEDVPGAVATVRVSRASIGTPACACCASRSRVAQSLGRLFQARARGEVGFFGCIVAALELAPEVRAALDEDVLVRARYRER